MLKFSWKKILLLVFILAAVVAIFQIMVKPQSGEEALPKVPSPSSPVSDVENKPNIVIVVADDLGYTDLGSYGGEIETPNLDSIAESGVQFSQFHVGAACSPSRAMLMTGVDNHLVGLGVFNEKTIASNQKGIPGYEGKLNKSAASLSEVFLDSGYHTYISGKWHLGYDAESSPPAFGFQRSFVQLEGGAGHFNELPVLPFQRKANYREDGRRVSLPENFYSSDFYTDKLISYIDQDNSSTRPFFAILAYTAPHWPLQAKKETIDKYEEKYKLGYERLAQQRIQSLVEKGLLDKPSEAQPYINDDLQRWDSLTEEEQQYEARRMAVYAAMIDDMDNAFGRFVSHLKEVEKYDNTLFVFLSDNGAEGHQMDFMASLVELSTLFGIECCDNSYENIGEASSFIDLGPHWVRASIGPHRIYKGFPTQGGIIAPAFISGNGVEKNKKFHEFASVKDVFPTLLEYAGIENHGSFYGGRKVHPLEGVSMLEMLSGQSDTVHNDKEMMGWELFGKHSVRFGEWKLLRMPPPYGENQWELYDLSKDPSEGNNLASTEPEMLQKMIKKWEEYKDNANIVLPGKMWWTY
ncbi:Arylsulfatase [Zhongshania aliphaticivorans]|uniref:Arylsulfatase n=1 Tax=Zhongshania aliphaticivorans TaxID=1470434 RepID=A0A5S9Q0G6_9GAMM|nr:arylsulfatase [Zhongshania aliphaticivorans]CAA0093082.1 Arylsulfatase [Zhongshania aliphaticivorans]CAA0110843.1 Arylsulfatase [Zhongshania aliphaticivorans]